MAMRDPGAMTTPFANSGDRTVIPKAVQPSGSVSFSQGWGPDYQKDPATDASAKPVDRATTNYLMYALSTLMGRWQTETFPEWIAAADNGGVAFGYPKGAIVRVGADLNTLRMSTRNANTSIPSATASTTDWADPFSQITDALRTSITDLQQVVGPVTFNGVLRSPLPAYTAKDSQVATTQWAAAGAAASVLGLDNQPAPSGYLRFPYFMGGGAAAALQICWGYDILPAQPGQYGATRNITYPLSFINQPNVFLTANGAVNQGGCPTMRVQSGTLYGFTAVIDANATVYITGTQGIQYATPYTWLAIGIGFKQPGS